MFDAEKILIALNKENGVDFCAPGYALGEAIIDALREAYAAGREDFKIELRERRKIIDIEYSKEFGPNAHKPEESK